MTARTDRGTASPAWVARLPAARKADQLFIVAGLGLDRTEAEVSLHQRTAAGEWTQVLFSPGFVGRNGLCRDRDHKEGCAMTPIGRYHFNRAFGIAEDPGCMISYYKVSENDYWSGDERKGMHYNKMVDIRDLPDLDRKHSEHLKEYGKLYSYCLSISFNEAGIPGRGSAIFVHCADPLNRRRYTEGCVALPERIMKQVMRLVRKDCAVIIDTRENLLKSRTAEMADI